MTGRQRALIFIIAGVCGLGSIVAFSWIVWRTMKSVIEPSPPTAADRNLVITADKLVPLGADEPNPEAEIFNAVRNFDGSINIEYDYSSSRDPHAEQFLSVSSSVFVFPNSLSAMQTYKVQQIALKGGMKLAKMRIREMPQLLTVGDQHYAAVTQRDGEPYGNLFLFRQGRAVHLCSISGLVIDDPAEAKMLFDPVAEATKRQFK